ncbi:response regulator [Rhizobium sp. P32RR-XVIII]|uniref:response regulator n=1 Tax=Rhizobium sp. P32RR-XVIII TaxID=2726738 RepID=UPI001456DE9E|nr:response regulator [Rhizobium sp. P32RR-XVIII]NLS06907.1 response regulator [Rhizobium sp. P32RR-XVIII]
MTTTPIISLDDEPAREPLPCLVRFLGFDLRMCFSAREFLSCASGEETQCLALDVAMLSTTGPELQAKLAWLRETIPIVFIMAEDDHDRKQVLIRRGAVDCLLKPFDDELRDALDRAFP